MRKARGGERRICVIVSGKIAAPEGGRSFANGICPLVRYSFKEAHLFVERVPAEIVSVPKAGVLRVYVQADFETALFQVLV